MFRVWAVLLCLMLLPGQGRTTALIDAQTGFSAKRMLAIDGRTYHGKVWAMPGKERHEQTIQGLRAVALLRDGSTFGDIVLTGLKTVVRFEVPRELRLLRLTELKRRRIGRETIDGIATVKYAVDEQLPEGHAKGTLWLSADGIPMRLSGTFMRADGKVVRVRWELNGVKTGPQPAALFEPPSGFAKLPPEAIAPLIGMTLKSSGLR